MVTVLFLFLDILSLIRFGTWVHAYSLFAMFRLKATTRDFFLTHTDTERSFAQVFPSHIASQVLRGNRFASTRILCCPCDQWVVQESGEKGSYAVTSVVDRPSIMHLFCSPFDWHPLTCKPIAREERESGSFLNSLKVIHCSVGSPPFSSFCFHTIRKPEGNQFTLY